MIHDKHKEWIEGRGLDPALAEMFGMETTRDGTGYWLTVPYRLKGEVINHKYRQTSEKRHRMDAKAPLILCNADCLSDPQVLAGASVIITEGEWDMMTAIQCGHLLTVSVPNGAPASLTDEPENATRYEWVWKHINELDKVKSFILAVDSDPAGVNLAADLAALLGPERCKFVEYPFPCKDLNEVLIEYGQARVTEVLNAAKQYPIKGLYRMSDFPERGEVKAYSTGIEPIDDMLKIVLGTLTVLTGFANMGKSSLVNAIMAHCIQNHFPVCVASFETDVKPILRDGLRKAILKCDDNELRRVDLSDADRIINERVSIVSQSVDEIDEMTIEQFLEYCRIAVVRDGVKMIVLDPWNELEHKRRRDEAETDYIGRALRAIKRFAKQHDIAFWIVAHPAKPQPGNHKSPGLYDISGSANWANKADYGLVYHRPDPKVNMAAISVVKVRMGLPGRRDSAEVMFNFNTSEFQPLFNG